MFDNARKNSYLCSRLAKNDNIMNDTTKYDLSLAIGRLREVVEAAVGRELKTPKDFDYLAERIFDKLHQKMSATTLKRLWGYLSENNTPRTSTLTLLAQFVDYQDWDDFCQKEGIPVIEGPITTPKPKKTRTIRTVLIAAVALALTAAALWFYQQSGRSVAAGHYVLRKGQVFPTYSDYLRLFGINDSATYWGRVLPHHPSIVVWGPEYHHPRWHNEGDRQQLMPTITEWWSSAQADSMWVVMRNADKYRHELRLNEMRITFMKNLTDTGYVFLGVYRLSLAQSDTTQCVWERVADDCDLSNLDYLEELRN